MMDSDFLYLVETELANEREKDPESLTNMHKAYAAIDAKLEAYFREIWKPDRKDASVLAGLVQIAAMCYRAAEDLQLVGFSRQSEWLKLPTAESRPIVRVGEWQGPFDERDPEAHQPCQEHKGKRFRADDPNQENLGMAINYVCLHGVEWTITGACLDALRCSQFSHCDCEPPWPTAEEIYARRGALPDYKF